LTAQQDTAQVAAIILAAGSGSRMGRLKQLLPYREGTLVQHAIEQAIEAGFAPVIVVAGARSDEVRASLSGMPVKIVDNADWQLGMGSSIACGMRALSEAAPQVAAVAILLADQPLVRAEHLRRMRDLLSPDSTAVAAEYGGSVGVPAIFKHTMFSALSSLQPNAGAKQILRDAPRVVAFPLSEAAADIDTPEDYARLTF
jgi:molybdenum cofactor cytidylyltransferase